MAVTLTREIRFGLYEMPEGPAQGRWAANGFAGNPALLGIAPFLTLAAEIGGTVDPATGMLVNIKWVDQVLREVALPRIRAGHFAPGRETAEVTLRALWPLLKDRFAPHALAQLRLAPSSYLAFTFNRKEPAMVRVSLKFEFSAAHRLHSPALSPEQNLAVFGRCNNPNGHGHNYEVEVVVSGEPDATGRVLALDTLQEIVHRRIIEPFDHKHLNLDCAEFQGGLNPTVENIAGVLFRQLVPHIPAPARLAALRVWETPKTMCEYAED